MSKITLDIKEYSEEDGSVTLTIDQLDICANGLTQEEAINDLVTDLQCYAKDYINRHEQYISSPTRKAHWMSHFIALEFFEQPQDEMGGLTVRNDRNKLDDQKTIEAANELSQNESSERDSISIHEKTPSLDDLFDKYKSNYRGGELDWGKPIGEELW